MATKTLTHLMAEQKITAPEALRQTLQLAQGLRNLHETGRVHGAVNPSHVSVAGPAWSLAPAGVAGTDDAYAAPEVLQGRPPDERSDIFGLGCILYELLAGNAPANPERPSCGNPAVDRLLANCLARDPAARYQRVQKLILELKVLTVGVNRANSPAPLRPQQLDQALRSELRQMEERTAIRLQGHEKAMRDIEAAMAAQNRGAAALEQSLSALADRVMDRMQDLEAAVTSSCERVSRLERGLEAFDRDSTALRDSVTADITNFERAIQAQTAAVQSARTALAQTDDLVERVVEALESLQSIVLEHAAEPAPGGARASN